MILLDTNVLVYAVNRDDPRHPACRALIEAARAGESACALVPQVLLEFTAILTDRRRVTVPLSPAEAWGAAAALRRIFPLLERCEYALDCFAGVLAERETKGSGIFDAWLVAQMRALGMSRICTYNTDDFSGHRGVQPVTPEGLGFGA